MPSVPLTDSPATSPTTRPSIPAVIADDHAHPVRLRLKPKAPPTGYVDGGWWPRTRDLTSEVPELAAVLAVRLGRVTRVAFTMTDWNDAPRKMISQGNIVRLEGFRLQERHLVTMSGSNGQRLILLVVPPEAGAAEGHNALMTAAHRDNADRPAAILLASGAVPERSNPAVPQPRQAVAPEQDPS